MSTEKTLVLERLRRLYGRQINYYIPFSVYAQRFIDKDRQYPLGL
ncbi:hypothetical protein DET54_107108 [Paenibacillus pabuli]|uniref:Uncharacterized protein n=1 Tax=Paenibacillus pabuli TaxID=1472 RepID=A0ABX9BJ94_9BACL|nr:hypothetical protein DET54_107108 [Paenibacillus pabuli]